MSSKSLYIQHCTRITKGKIWVDGQLINNNATSPQDVYRQIKAVYPKFFKMDNLCKWAWLATHLTVPKYENPEDVAVVIHSHHGCIDVDRQFLKSLETIPSPALFVYTLPNIMLGEISITYKFKGQQTLLMTPAFDPTELVFNVQALRHAGKCPAVLCGWVNVHQQEVDCCIFWVDEQCSETPFTAEYCNQIYQQTAHAE